MVLVTRVPRVKSHGPGLELKMVSLELHQQPARSHIVTSSKDQK
jgi:uncharacterized protein YaiL (DUF2058 family)